MSLDPIPATPPELNSLCRVEGFKGSKKLGRPVIVSPGTKYVQPRHASMSGIFWKLKLHCVLCLFSLGLTSDSHGGFVCKIAGSFWEASPVP